LRSCNPTLIIALDDAMTEIIVNKIVGLAKAGEHDADRLAEEVLADLVGKAA